MPALSQKNAPAFVRFFCSLELTITCLVFGMLLIFFGTLAQVHLGIHQVQAQFFHSWLAWWSPADGSWRVPILPGGFLIGGVLLINLIAAFIYRFELTKKKFGLMISHFGIILLLLGELFTALYQRDSGMWLNEGDTKSYAESFRTLELAIIDRTDPATDKVLAIHEKELRKDRTIQDPAVPFRIAIRGYYANSEVLPRGPQTSSLGAPLATVGEGGKLTARELPRTGKQNENDRTVAWVELFGAEGSLGTWMVDIYSGGPQTFTYAGRKFSIGLRHRRFYEPFTLTLIDFSHDRYPGTEIARNFSSKVRLRDPRRQEDREALIYMNHPLRYGGLTFFQASFRGEETSMLQVVQNPSRLLPYIACALVFGGLTIQFSVHLSIFLARRKKTTP